MKRLYVEAKQNWPEHRSLGYSITEVHWVKMNVVYRNYLLTIRKARLKQAEDGARKVKAVF